jgi:hypothetical protein
VGGGGWAVEVVNGETIVQDMGGGGGKGERWGSRTGKSGVVWEQSFFCAKGHGRYSGG